MIIRFVGIKMADFLWSVFNPSITNTATDFLMPLNAIESSCTGIATYFEGTV